MVSDWAGIAELATGDAELLDEEKSPSKKCLPKSKRLLQRQERHEWFDACVAEADSDTDNF
jgi:hypothetical protein